MAVNVTTRDYAYKSASSADLVCASFTPAANSVLMVVLFGEDGAAEIDSITGHGTWSQAFSYTGLAGKVIDVWACLVGSSPSASTITVANGYAWRSECEFFELTGVDVSGGTVASLFGVTGGVSGYDLRDEVLTLASFASSNNATFAVATTGATSAWQDGTFTVGTQRSSSGWYFQTAWLASEDTSVAVTFDAWSTDALFAFEIKAAGAASFKSAWARHANQLIQQRL